MSTTSIAAQIQREVSSWPGVTAQAYSGGMIFFHVGQREIGHLLLECPQCRGRLQILAAIHPPENTRKILECLHLPTRAPPTKAAVSESLNESC